jgi:hypothetical protein
MKSHKPGARTQMRASEPRAALYMRVSTGRQAEHVCRFPISASNCNPGVVRMAML